MFYSDMCLNLQTEYNELTLNQKHWEPMYDLTFYNFVGDNRRFLYIYSENNGNMAHCLGFHMVAIISLCQGPCTLAQIG